jgi:peptide/nickel transport system permease protein
VVFRHVLRNASGPGIVSLGLITLGLIGGTLFIEDVFALPGIGQLANRSAQSGDVPLVMGTVIVVALIVLIVNFLIDLAGTALNPKARTR